MSEMTISDMTIDDKIEFVGRLMDRSRLEGKSLQDGCWIWEGATTRRGYGTVSLEGRTVSVHRISAAVWHGLDLEDSDSFALHSCDVRGCWNPNHVRVGSAADNARDRSERGRTAAGSRNGNARLNEHEVQIVRLLLATGRSQREIGEFFHVCQSTVSKIARGVVWKGI